jgi:hypothetical protein
MDDLYAANVRRAGVAPADPMWARLAERNRQVAAVL